MGRKPAESNSVRSWMLVSEEGEEIILTKETSNMEMG